MQSSSSTTTGIGVAVWLATIASFEDDSDDALDTAKEDDNDDAVLEDDAEAAEDAKEGIGETTPLAGNG
jgi:hypothetical protein